MQLFTLQVNLEFKSPIYQMADGCNNIVFLVLLSLSLSLSLFFGRGSDGVLTSDIVKRTLYTRRVLSENPLRRTGTGAISVAFLTLAIVSLTGS